MLTTAAAAALLPLDVRQRATLQPAYLAPVYGGFTTADAQGGGRTPRVSLLWDLESPKLVCSWCLDICSHTHAHTRLGALLHVSFKGFGNKGQHFPQIVFFLAQIV